MCLFRPLPQIVWSKDGYPVESSDRVTQGHYGKSLIIKHVTFEDQGSYTCEASNGVGSAQTYSINLQVQGESQTRSSANLSSKTFCVPPWCNLSLRCDDQQRTTGRINRNEVRLCVAPRCSALPHMTSRRYWLYPRRNLHQANPLPPSDDVRKQKKSFQRIFSVQFCHYSKNITPLETWNLIITAVRKQKQIF